MGHINLICGPDSQKARCFPTLNEKHKFIAAWGQHLMEVVYRAINTEYRMNAYCSVNTVDEMQLQWSTETIRHMDIINQRLGIFNCCLFVLCRKDYSKSTKTISIQFCGGAQPKGEPLPLELMNGPMQEIVLEQKQIISHMSVRASVASQQTEWLILILLDWTEGGKSWFRFGMWSKLSIQIVLRRRTNFCFVCNRIAFSFILSGSNQFVSMCYSRCLYIQGDNWKWK